MGRGMGHEMGRALTASVNGPRRETEPWKYLVTSYLVPFSQAPKLTRPCTLAGLLPKTSSASFPSVISTFLPHQSRVPEEFLLFDRPSQCFYSVIDHLFSLTYESLLCVPFSNPVPSRPSLAIRQAG